MQLVKFGPNLVIRLVKNGGIRSKFAKNIPLATEAPAAKIRPLAIEI